MVLGKSAILAGSLEWEMGVTRLEQGMLASSMRSGLLAQMGCPPFLGLPSTSYHERMLDSFVISRFIRPFFGVKGMYEEGELTGKSQHFGNRKMLLYPIMTMVFFTLT